MQKSQAQPRPHVMKLDELAQRGFAESKAHAGELRVFVLHTSRQLTKACLSAVSALTSNLGARVTLLAVQIVPFPLPLDRPDVAPQFVERELVTMAGGNKATVDGEGIVAMGLGSWVSGGTFARAPWGAVSKKTRGGGAPVPF